MELEDYLNEEYPDFLQEEDDPFGCLFPEKCVVAGEHREGECYTAEEAEEMEANHASLDT